MNDEQQSAYIRGMEYGISIGQPKLRADNKAMLKMLEKIQWCFDGPHYDEFCPRCGAEENKGHEDDCELAKFLK